MVLDGVGGPIARAAFEMTARGGRFSAYGSAGGDYAELTEEEAARRGVTVQSADQVHIGGTDIARRSTEHVLSEAAAGRLRPVIGRTFPLDRAAEAHAALESRGVVGRIVLLT